MKPHIYPSTSETACSLISHILKKLEAEPDKQFNIAFSGGNTPTVMFDLWANDFAEETPWNRINFWWVDERCVSPDDTDSNYGLMRKLLLDVVSIPAENIFRIRGEKKPESEALRYSKLAWKYLPVSGKLPAFDIVLLGVGKDGHTSSIFPGQEHLLSSPNLYEPSINPHNGQRRIALTGQPIINSECVIFHITGSEKADVVYEMCTSGDTSPAAYIAHRARYVELFIDIAAASRL